jgi:hypothetical protein
LASYVEWQREQQLALKAASSDGNGSGSFKFVLHRVRCDATNADIWQKSKLHVAEVWRDVWMGDSDTNSSHSNPSNVCCAPWALRANDGGP